MAPDCVCKLEAGNDINMPPKCFKDSGKQPYYQGTAGQLHDNLIHYLLNTPYAPARYNYMQQNFHPPFLFVCCCSSLEESFFYPMHGLYL